MSNPGLAFAIDKALIHYLSIVIQKRLVPMVPIISSYREKILR
jgi:hypothetical protein